MGGKPAYELQNWDKPKQRAESLHDDSDIELTSLIPELRGASVTDQK